MRGVGRFGPLRERQFRLLWFARTGSSVGDSLIPVALIWAVSHDLGGGATEVGLVLACYTFGGAAVLMLVPEVRSLRRRDADPEPEREPALSAL